MPATQVDLDQCPVKDGFRLRGLGMTRTETFTDAAFAFAVTLLVVSIDQIPSSYQELVAAMYGIPAFALSFLLLFLFWYAHWQWSRRFGLEDLPTILLSFGLVFVVLCYVYPLKYMVNGMIIWITGGRVRSGGQANITLPDLYSLFVIYGVGFAALCGIVVLLNVHAWRRREALSLDAIERFDTRGEIGAWSLVGCVGLLSALMGLLLPPSPKAIPGFAYMILPIIMPIYGVIAGRRRRALAARGT